MKGLGALVRLLMGGCVHEDLIVRDGNQQLRLKCLHCLRETKPILDVGPKRYHYIDHQATTVAAEVIEQRRDVDGAVIVDGGPAPDGRRLEDMTRADRIRIQVEFNHPSVLPS